MGITYSSLTKVQPNKQAATRDRTPNVQKIRAALDFMKKRRDKATLNCKRILVDAAKKMSLKYSSGSALYCRRKQSHASKSAQDFLEKASIHLPGVKSVKNSGSELKGYLHSIHSRKPER